MITLHIWFKSEWSIDQIEAVKEVIQRMGWCMDDVPDKSNGYPVNLPIEEVRMFFVIQDGIDAMKGEME